METPTHEPIFDLKIMNATFYYDSVWVYYTIFDFVYEVVGNILLPLSVTIAVGTLSIRNMLLFLFNFTIWLHILFVIGI